MIVTIDIRDSVADKVLYFISKLKDDVKIVKNKDINNIDIETINKSDKDYDLYLKAKKERKNGEKTYPLDSLISEYI